MFCVYNGSKISTGVVHGFCRRRLQVNVEARQGFYPSVTSKMVACEEYVQEDAE